MSRYLRLTHYDKVLDLRNLILNQAKDEKS